MSVESKEVSTTDIFRKSILVSAHPDDEVLWFGSILDKVDEVVICFLGITSEPNRRIERQKSLLEYPMKKISCFDIDQSETFYGVDWQNPLITKYGIDISNKKYSDKRYKENYYKLKGQLEEKLAGYRNVFTHNPWGEYGSDEHIQVYRVIKALQEKMKFNLWFSNACSNKSFKLMLDYIQGVDLEYVSFKTNTVLANDIKNLYRKNNCWTWYDNWEWFDEETFLRDKGSSAENAGYGRHFPLNLIKVYLPTGSPKKIKSIKSLLSHILKNRNEK